MSGNHHIIILSEALRIQGGVEGSLFSQHTTHITRHYYLKNKNGTQLHFFYTHVIIIETQFHFFNWPKIPKDSKNMTNWLEETLNNSGISKTLTRKKLYREIFLQKGIFSANQIIERTGLSKVSVYRNLDLLKKLNLIRSAITVKGQEFYEKNNDENHHHHIICTECLKTRCVECNEPKILSKEKFQNINHLLIFTGICNTCTKSN